MISNIMEKYQTKVYKKYGVFCAFSDKQFNKGINPNFGKVMSLGGGTYCPSIFADKVVDQLNGIYDKAIAKVQATHTKKDIIWYALGNHETQITGDCTDAINSLANYPGISKQDIFTEYNDYYNYCVDNNYF